MSRQALPLDLLRLSPPPRLGAQPKHRRTRADRRKHASGITAGAPVSGSLASGRLHARGDTVQQATQTPEVETAVSSPHSSEPAGGTDTPSATAACMVPPGSPAPPDLDEPAGVLSWALGYLESRREASPACRPFSTPPGSPPAAASGTFLDLNGDSVLTWYRSARAGRPRRRVTSGSAIRRAGLCLSCCVSWTGTSPARPSAPNRRAVSPSCMPAAS